MIRLGMFLGDRYEILEKIGSGGMAEVFKGKDHKLNRLVAVKVLKDEFVEDKNFVRKFKEEAQAAAALAHPNIVNVYDVGDEQNVKYIVMELVEGITLKNYIERKGRLTVKEATSIAIQVSAGLEIAHNNHIVHRDIKPQNIIISKEGKVKVTDFGIAKSVSSNTNTSDAMGSVHYTSPEQARGGYSDAKSDIYSLGIVLYEMVTGRVPFDGETTVVVAVKHLQEEIVSPRVYASNIPVSLEHIILKCTEKSPDRRYAHIGDLQADLKQSLVTPDVNFVKTVDAGGARTVAISRDDLTRIKRETGRLHLNQEDEEDPFGDEEYEDGYEGYEDEYEEEYEDEEYEDEYEDGEYEEDGEQDGDLDPRLEKIMTIGGIAAAVIIVIIIIVIVVKMFGIGSGGKEPEDDKDIKIEDVLDDDEKDQEDQEQVEVPDLLGKSYAEAKETLNNVNLGISFGETKEMEGYEEGQIIGQSVEKGTKVEKNTTIVVDICGGNDQQEVPNVVGVSESEARKALTDAGFTVDVRESYHDSVAAGKVISASPSVGSKAAKGSVVTLELSKGPQETKIKVPALVGSTESRAKEKLRAANLSVGSVTQEFSDKEAGYVISQGVPENTEVPENTAISFVVSKGPENKDVYIGNYSGMSEADAYAKAKDKGLNPIVDYENSDNIGNGLVTRTDPVNGSTVKPGTTIKIWVSKGKEKVNVPDLLNKTESEAASALSSAGLSLGIRTTGEAANSADMAGRVYNWDSKGGQVDKGTVINVTIYGAYVAPPTPQEPPASDPGTGTGTDPATGITTTP
ncbi:MAG: Stk1 family PASTA domain-containing Ser/Thr kinase [Lachnospiraceae bacterium]|nr:Stk1 family PASTA domain-containing Ser/Thr kinase [Lachnospiraceae bacterium]